MSAQSTFAATLVDEWVRCGVRHAVVAPGSRSTPLALAIAADRRLQLHVHHDERAAAFLALGIGLGSGAPAIVLTTSGTAAVELHPAVVEAHQGRVPMVVCTADRPPELHGVGAAQTVDQTHLFGRSVRWFAEPGIARDDAARTWRSLAARAVHEATASPPGPVHLNLAFAEPLVAPPGPLPQGRPDGRAWHDPRPPLRLPDTGLVRELADLLAAGRRGVVVAGGGAGEPTAVHRLAGALGWPVLADPRSGCRVPAATTVGAADAALRVASVADELRPEVVVRLGAPPASKVVAQWLAASGAHQVAVDAHGSWWDPDRTAAQVLAVDPTALCRALVDELARRRDGRAPAPWLARWRQVERAAQEAIDDWARRLDRLSEPAVARAVVDALPDGATLVVSSSMPVRDVEWYGRPRSGVRILANRGANGIDGVLSSAVGVAATGGGPVVALLGDIAFLHDSNALLGLADRDLDLTAVVVDNRGGGIFSFLPQAAALDQERFERLFGTPHAVDLPSLAAVHGVPALRVVAAEGLLPALHVALTTSGTHAVVVGTDRESNVADHEDVHAAVAAAVTAAG